MKTGRDVQEDPIDPQHLIVLLTIFTQDATRLALAYADHKNAEETETEDFIKGLKVRAFYGSEFWSDPNVQERIEKTRGILESISEPNDILDYMTAIESETSDDSTMNLSSFESESQQIYNECDCIICSKMNIIDSLWTYWDPRQKSDQILKNAINEVVAKYS